MVTNMIIECKIELDWIEDGSVDEKIQARIVKAAVDQVGVSIAKREEQQHGQDKHKRAGGKNISVNWT